MHGDDALQHMLNHSEEATTQNGLEWMIPIEKLKEACQINFLFILSEK